MAGELSADGAVDLARTDGPYAALTIALPSGLPRLARFGPARGKTGTGGRRRRPPASSADRLAACRNGLMSYRLSSGFSGERPRLHQSTTVHLIRSDDLLAHLSAEDRPQAFTAVVSTALAAG